MKAALCILLLATGCASTPPVAEPECVEVMPPIVMAPPAPVPGQTPASKRAVEAVVIHKDKLVARAGSYVIQPHAKSGIVDKLGDLTRAAQYAAAQLSDAKTPAERAAAMPVAKAAIEALALYLSMKGEQP